MAYSIVAFEDGILAVPTKWINKKKTECLFPKQTENASQAIKHLRDPGDDWDRFPILRIFTTAGV